MASQWLRLWHGCWCQTGCFEYFRKILISRDSGAQQTLESAENGVEKQKSSNERQLCGQKCLVEKKSQRRQEEDRKESCSYSNNRSLQPWWAEKQPRMRNTPNLEANGLKQQKTPISQEQEYKASVGTGLPNLGTWPADWMHCAPTTWFTVWILAWRTAVQVFIYQEMHGSNNIKILREKNIHTLRNIHKDQCVNCFSHTNHICALDCSHSLANFMPG